ncbi:MAG: 50S ribosomal protein L17 [Spirochaetaceae bacterium]|nr:MAG: 50S ribosomal protein L17 [Spirochaetaceae bacterium]
MRHRVGFNTLGRKSAHRKALHRNMVTSLFHHERIRTTKAKARAIRRTAEKMITRAKVDSVHNRRMVARDIKDKAVLAKLFVEIGPRFKERPGGYTRMLKIGYRDGDASEMVLLELVGDEKPVSGTRKKRDTAAAAASKRAGADSKPAKKKDEAAKKSSGKQVAAETKAVEAEAAEVATVADDTEATDIESDAPESADAVDEPDSGSKGAVE